MSTELLNSINNNVSQLITTVQNGVNSWQQSMDLLLPFKTEVEQARGLGNSQLTDRFAPLENTILVDYLHTTGNTSQIILTGFTLKPKEVIQVEAYWVTNSASSSGSVIFVAVNAVDSSIYGTIKTGTNYQPNLGTYANNTTYGTHVFGTYWTTYGYECGYLLDTSDVNYNVVQIQFNDQTRQPYYMGYGLRHRLSGAFYNGFRNAPIPANTNITSLVFINTNTAINAGLSGIANGSRIIIRRIR